MNHDHDVCKRCFLPEDFNPDASPYLNTLVNLLEESSEEEESPLFCSQPSLSESIYTKPIRATLLELFEKEATPPPIWASGKKPPKRTMNRETVTALVIVKAEAKAPTKHDAVDESEDKADTVVAEAATEANIITKT
jgi:hypothetical protein